MDGQLNADSNDNNKWTHSLLSEAWAMALLCIEGLVCAHAHVDVDSVLGVRVGVLR